DTAVDLHHCEPLGATTRTEPAFCARESAHVLFEDRVPTQRVGEDAREPALREGRDDRAQLDAPAHRVALGGNHEADAREIELVLERLARELDDDLGEL